MREVRMPEIPAAVRVRNDSSASARTATDGAPRNGHRGRRRPVTDIALIAVFAALIAACSVIAIPIGAAPITLQTFAVLLSGAALGATRGLLAVLLYLTLGAIGLPVFAGGTAGLAPFAGATVGYLVSFPLAAWLTGLLTASVIAFVRRKQLSAASATSFTVALIFAAALVSSIVFTYTLGIAGLAWRAGLTIGEAFIVNLAFVPLDLAKMGLAAVVAAAVHRAFPELLRRSRRRVAG